MIQLTDLCVTEKADLSKTVESNSEDIGLKQEEDEKSDQCEECCLGQKDSINGQEVTVEAENPEKDNENTEKDSESSDQGANNESSMEVPTEGLSSTTECINQSEPPFLTEDSLKEDGDITSDFNKLSLDADDDLDVLNELSDSEPKVYEVVNEDPETAFCTLATRETLSSEEGSILHCLYQFTHNEKLCENNKLLCDVCTQKQLCGPKTVEKSMLNLSLLKLILIYSYQAILTYSYT